MSDEIGRDELERRRREEKNAAVLAHLRALAAGKKLQKVKKAIAEKIPKAALKGYVISGGHARPGWITDPTVEFRRIRRKGLYLASAYGVITVDEAESA
jgi:hypothetical protein